MKQSEGRYLSLGFKVRNLLLLLVAVAALVSCKPGVPGKYIQPGKMADILYDYQLAQTVFQQQGGDSLTLLSYYDNIFNKYDVSKAEFDSSLVYYTRHTRQLYDIYKRVGERFDRELAAQGGTTNAFAQYGDNIASGDTANIWRGDVCFALTPQQSSNIVTFDAPVDTSFHKGDRVILDFDTQLIYQEGVRNVVAVLKVTLSNDSVVTDVRQLMSSSHYHMQVEDTGKLGIKGVQGFFMLGYNSSEGLSTTLSLAVMYNVKLLKMHVHDAPNAGGVEAADSMKAPLPSGHGPVPDQGGMPTKPLAPKHPVKDLRPVKMVPVTNDNLKPVADTDRKKK